MPRPAVRSSTYRCYVFLLSSTLALFNRSWSGIPNNLAYSAMNFVDNVEQYWCKMRNVLYDIPVAFTLMFGTIPGFALAGPPFFPHYLEPLDCRHFETCEHLQSAPALIHSMPARIGA
jgi:hypothetical protein